MLLEPYFLYDYDYAAVERSVVAGPRNLGVLDALTMGIQIPEFDLERMLKAGLLAEVCTAQSTLDLG